MKSPRLSTFLLTLGLVASLAVARAATAAPLEDDDPAAAEQAQRAQRQADKAEKQKQKEQEKAAREAEKEAARLERAAGISDSGSSSSRGLSGTNLRVLSSRLGQDPQIREYVRLVQSGEAKAAQVAMLGNALAEAGAMRAAGEYYAEAIRLQPNNADLWVNYGTVLRRANDLAGAVAAYRKAVSIDPNHPVAHYNLGAAYHEQDKYEEALQEYLTAFALDPSLADPRQNPQVVNNSMMLPLQVIRYQQQSGALGLPLAEIPDGKLSD